MADTEDMATPIWLKRKILPSTLLMLIVLGPIAIFVFLEAGFSAGEWGIAIILPGFLLSGLLVNLLSDRGYQLGADGERIYMREYGLRGFLGRVPPHTMVYGNIVSMEGLIKPGATHSSNVPFDLLELRSADPDEERILISPASFPSDTIKGFLRDLYQKRPDIFPDYVLSYLTSTLHF